MSNPGVIVLASLRGIGRTVKRFDIEDNLGEAIHLHINNLRLDLTIREFLDLAECTKAALTELDVAPGLGIDHLDPFFLYRMGDMVNHITSFSVEERKLVDLRCIVKKDVRRVGSLMVPTRVENAPAYRYLIGDSDHFVRYDHDPHPGLQNDERLAHLVTSIKEEGYPLGNKRIVLFGDQNYIRDGQHRACVLGYLKGLNASVSVTVVRFDIDSWKLSPYRQATSVMARRVGLAVKKRLRGYCERLRYRAPRT